jgi:hypothetical protein
MIVDGLLPMSRDALFTLSWRMTGDFFSPELPAASFPMALARLSRRGQLSQAGSAQVGQGPGTAITNIPCDTENDCDPGPKEGNSQRCVGVLRHSRTATTADVYIQEIPANVQATVNSIHSELKTKVKSLAGDGAESPRARHRTRARITARGGLSVPAEVAAVEVLVGSRERGGKRTVFARSWK